MIQVQAILVCSKFDDRWELPIPASGTTRVFIVGWEVSPAPVDAGPPEPVARLLSSALTRHSMISYPCRKKRQIEFVHTKEWRTVEMAFEAEYFDWSQQNQVLFLSPAESPVPVLSRNHISAAREPEGLQQLLEVGVTGLVLPGVDGDVAGFYTAVDDLQRDLIDDLRGACAETGSQLLMVSQPELIERLGNRSK